MENLKERLIFVIEKLGLTKAKFEKDCGLSNGFVDKSGDNTRRASLDKISKTYPNININWLITGEGEMLRATAQNGSGVQINGNNGDIVNGDNNRLVVGASGTAETERLREKVVMLERLLEEKERTIQILMKR